MDGLEPIIERLDNHEERLSAAEMRAAKHDVNIALLQKDNEYIKKSLDRTEQTVKEIDSKLTAMMLSPAKELRRFIWAIATAAVVGIGGYLIGLAMR